MQTQIKQVSPVEYELEIHATAADLEPELQKALRTQQGRTQLKGFRPGKVPLTLVKKMYGRALAYELADRTVQQTYESEVLESGAYQVLGQPKLTRLDYDVDSDLNAVIRFGTRPEVTFEDLSGETLPKLVHPVTDEEVDKALERLRRENADLASIEDEPIGPEDHVIVDLQQIDDETGTPIIGSREEGTAFFLDDERLQDQLRDAIVGKKAGDTFRVELPHGHGDHVHTHRYEVTIKEAKRRELADLDDEFAKEATNNRLETLDALRQELKDQLQRQWENESRELLEGMMIQRLLERHPVPVPESIIETFLDQFVEDVKQRNEGKLPAGFNEEAFRTANREEAERQARWMILRDALIEQENLSVSDEELDAFFEEAAGESPGIPAEMLRQYYQQMNLLERVRQRKLSDKVYDVLQSRFNIVEKDREAYEQDLQERANEGNEAASAADEPSRSEQNA